MENKITPISISNFLPDDVVEKCVEAVNHPSHYTTGKIETIDVIKDTVTDYKSYLHGNIIKYISRYKHKNGVEDLHKARVYLDWLIEEEGR